MTDDRLLLSRIRKAGAHLRYFPRTLLLVWRASGKWTIAWAALVVIQGLLPIITVSLTRELVDRGALVFLTKGDTEALRAALIPAGLMAAALLLGEILRSGSHWIRAAQSELVLDYVAGLIQRQSMDADLAFYETPEYFDHLHRARAEASYRPQMLLDSSGFLLQNGITLIGMAALLFQFGLWLPVALFLSTLPAFYVVLRYAVRHYQWRQSVTAEQRKADYIDELLSSAPAAAELRLFDLGDYFRSSFQTLRKRLREERISLGREQSLAEFSAGIAALALNVAALAWMSWRAVQGLISLGDLAMFYHAFQEGLQLMRSLLEHAGETYGNLLYAGNLFAFFDLKPRIVSPSAAPPFPAQVREGIRFTNVTFCYPATERPAIQDLNLFVPAGKVVAVVGPNGSGKSTLIKLLARFYDPDQGTITVDGIDIRKFEIQDLRRNLTVLFQRPIEHRATVKENIEFGDIRTPLDMSTIQHAASAAGAEEIVHDLPAGYHTLLGKNFFRGIELSVGEWQRIALARAIVRQAPVILLDEPTSAVDPWAEADWLKRFREAAAGKTAIVITHRFTTAMLADEIHVMQAGRVVERGTHAELIRAGGLYFEWWRAQGLEKTRAQAQ